MLSKLLVFSIASLFTYEPPESEGVEDSEVKAQTQASQHSFQTLTGFLKTLRRQLKRSLPEERLPTSFGNPVEPGVYFTVSNSSIYAFDRPVVEFKDGKLPDTWVSSPACKSGCPATLYEEMRRLWLRLSNESQQVNLDLPTRSLFAFDRDVSAKLAISFSYAVAEARPGLPPSMHMLVSSGRGGVRARPFYLLPPKGLRSFPGDVPLGLTIEVGKGNQYRVDALDPRFGAAFQVGDPNQLRNALKEVKKKFPGKRTIILVPQDNVSLAELLGASEAARGYFDRLVFSLKGAKSSTSSASMM